MNVDDQLLQTNNESPADSEETAADEGADFNDDFSTNETNQASRLREEKNKPETDLEETEQEITAPAESLREQVQQARIKQEQQDSLTDAQAGGQAPGSNPIQQGTSALLKSAWENIISSWGLSFIWVDIHLFLRTVLSKTMFCAPGDEWTNNSLPGAGQTKRMLNTVEPIGIGCMNLGCLLLLFLVACVISLIAWALNHPWHVLLSSLQDFLKIFI
jgi:hypothetical protein